MFYRIPPRLETVLKATYESIMSTFTVGGGPGEVGVDK